MEWVLLYRNFENVGTKWCFFAVKCGRQLKKYVDLFTIIHTENGQNSVILVLLRPSLVYAYQRFREQIHRQAFWRQAVDFSRLDQE